MLGALLYLRLKSLETQVRSRTGRLRQPKYLVGAVATAAYLYYFFFRHLVPSSGPIRGRGPAHDRSDPDHDGDQHPGRDGRSG